MKPAFLLALLALGACTSVAAVPAGPAAIGQVTAVESLQVRPLELLEDSRCPASVQCIWAGQVRLLVEVTRSDGAHQQRELTLGKPQNIDWGLLTLADVQPAKVTPGTTDPRQYRFTFRFER